jgi:hypothetical protein
MRTIKIALLVSVLIPLSNISCKKFLEEKVISDNSYSFYETPTGVESGVAAAYDAAREFFASEANASFTEMGTDMYFDGRDASWRTQLNRYEATLNSNFLPLYDNIWSPYYRGVNKTNFVLDALVKNPLPDMSASLKLTRQAELNYLRGLYYFFLVQTFGKVPLVVTPDLGVRTDFKRASVEELYRFIITNLRFAADNLPLTQADYGRATKGAAQHTLALVYLTRASAVTDKRGQKPADLDSAAYYADQVIASNTYKLLPDFKDLWDISNQKNSEVIFAVQFSKTLLNNNNGGNRMHLFFNMTYDLKPGMTRTLQNGRPWNRLRPTDFNILQLYDRKNDSRFYKTFQSVWYANNQASIPKWPGAGPGYVPNESLRGKPKFALGDTAIWVTAEKYPAGTNLNDIYAKRAYYYMPVNRQGNADYFALRKHLDPVKFGDVGSEVGSRDGLLFRFGETYLIAAEAYGRKGDFATAVARLNLLRKRAAYREGEAKPTEYWRVEGGSFADRQKSTEPELLLTEASISTNFIDFILDERARELNGELRRWWDLTRTEKLVERVKKYNPGGAVNVKPFHMLRPVPQNHIDRLNPKGAIEEEQNEGYY